MATLQIDTTPGIKNLDVLADVCDALRRQGRRIVHCHGVFDLVHIGHIRHFQKAREYGDVLVVTVTPDEHVNKGPHRPAFNQQLRAEAVAALEAVDYVAINRWPNAVRTIGLVKPDFYVKGADYIDAEKDVTGGIALERAAVEAVGGAMVFTQELTSSSTQLLNRHLPAFSPQTREYLDDFRTRFSASDLHHYLESLKGLKVLLLGEAIIDDYHYCRTMGKSGKEPILAACYERRETFAGGALAVANHVAAFTDHVDLVTFLGAHDSHEAFVRKALHDNVTPTFLTLAEGPTIVKRRFVESYPFQKLFEVYVMGDDEEDPTNSATLCDALRTVVTNYDVVLAIDYGHGMFSHEAIELLCEQAPYLCVNTQVNAGNQGFNTISKFPRADFISLSENEIRMDVRKRKRPLTDIARHVATRHHSSNLLITRGKNGSLCYGEEGTFEIPAFSGQAVDRVGAGDAVFAVTSLCARRGVPSEALAIIGNAVGMQTVQTVGNCRAIDKTALYKFLEHSLK